ncbi:energy-coupled thiamine transporter ThiT [Clostridium sp.]|uniref:energy-coupled thiamine transporter ThiT n=1 Tax=Clostridium sp. TaxID=1506 RepID=UPI003FA55D73
MIINGVIVVVTIVIFIIYGSNLKKNPLGTKKLVAIGMYSAIAFMLYLIHFITYPQGGGITLFSMLPIMLLSIFYGPTAGVTGGLIFGLLKVFNNPFIIHPVQFLLDYILSNMALGLVGIFGTNRRLNINIGAIFSVALSVAISILSGAVFFGQYAPSGMNVFLYSFIYNASSGGVEGILTIIVMNLLPIKKLKDMALRGN